LIIFGTKGIKQWGKTKELNRPKIGKILLKESINNNEKYVQCRGIRL